MGGELARSIHWHLAADKEIQVESMDEVAALITQGILSGPVPNIYELKEVHKRVNRQYAAYGRLLPVNIASKRVLWMPWHMKVTFSQVVELRVSDMASGELSSGQDIRAEKQIGVNSLSAYSRWSEIDPKLRDEVLQELGRSLALESARAIGEVLNPKETEAPKVEGEAVPEAKEEPEP